MKRIKQLWIAIFVLCLLSPLGLLASGDAWGEWGKEFFQKLLGFVPEGLDRYSDIWKAPLPDYTIPGLGEVPGYILSAAAGIALVIAITWFLGKALSGTRNSRS